MGDIFEGIAETVQESIEKANEIIQENNDLSFDDVLNELNINNLDSDNQETKLNKKDKAELSFEEFCQRELDEARERNKEDPDWDYRNYYCKGQTVYVVRVYNYFLKEKKILTLKLRTVYPRMLIGIDDFGCECIGFNERNNIFENIVDANTYYEGIDAETEEEFNKHLTTYQED